MPSATVKNQQTQKKKKKKGKGKNKQLENKKGGPPLKETKHNDHPGEGGEFFTPGTFQNHPRVKTSRNTPRIPLRRNDLVIEYPGQTLRSTLRIPLRHNYSISQCTPKTLINHSRKYTYNQ